MLLHEGFTCSLLFLCFLCSWCYIKCNSYLRNIANLRSHSLDDATKTSYLLIIAYLFTLMITDLKVL